MRHGRTDTPCARDDGGCEQEADAASARRVAPVPANTDLWRWKSGGGGVDWTRLPLLITASASPGNPTKTRLVSGRAKAGVPKVTEVALCVRPPGPLAASGRASSPACDFWSSDPLAFPAPVLITDDVTLSLYCPSLLVAVSAVGWTASGLLSPHPGDTTLPKEDLEMWPWLWLPEACPGQE